MDRTAAVCVVIHESSLLLMRRKKRDGDPWSGDMSFPGGFSKEGESPMETALREFTEETGIDCAKITVEREMNFLHTARNHNLKVFPVIFRSDEEFKVNAGDEMEYGGWYNLHMAAMFQDPFRGQCLQFGNDTVWGLTYRIIEKLGILPISE